MKAITIHQPYAHLVATGDKRVENRSWLITYRGPIAIHAGKSLLWLDLNDDKTKDVEYDIDLSDMAFGAVVATAEIRNSRFIQPYAQYAYSKWRHYRIDRLGCISITNDYVRSH